MEQHFGIGRGLELYAEFGFQSLPYLSEVIDLTVVSKDEMLVLIRLVREV
jgi:hypothetical protein